MAVSPEIHTAIRRSAKERVLLALLPVGRGNAITASELAALMTYRLGIPVKAREVRQIVSDLRRRGVLIASATGPPYGFYRPEDLREAQECRDQLAGRLRELRRTVAAYDRAVRRMEWQERVEVRPLPGIEQGA